MSSTGNERFSVRNTDVLSANVNEAAPVGATCAASSEVTDARYGAGLFSHFIGA